MFFLSFYKKWHCILAENQYKLKKNLRGLPFLSTQISVLFAYICHNFQ